MNDRVLIVEDDVEIADLVALHLKDLNLETDRAVDGERGLALALSGDYDLLILDLMLPRMNGLEVCKAIRKQDEALPILMLTSKSEELDKVLGLELGADDYVAKPFSVRELMARVKALLRRVPRGAASSGPDRSDEVITVEDLAIDLGTRRVTLGDRSVELTAKEFDLLVLFASNPGRVFSRKELLDKVWGYQFEGYGHTVNSHINRLRAKIEENPADPKRISTVWGVGYRFLDPEADPDGGER